MKITSIVYLRRAYGSVCIHFSVFAAVAVFFTAAAFAQTAPATDRAVPQSRTPNATTGIGGANVKNAKILDKPRAPYTEIAKRNGIEGSVRLRVELLASGEIGEIAILSHLPHGLTEQAQAAAKQIRFEPKTIQGKPVDSSVSVEYTFSLYHENDDADIISKVEILRMPKPEINASELPSSANGRIELKVFFSSDGRASIVNTVTPVPFDLQARLRDAVEKIRFRAAVHRSGKRSGVTKIVVYEL